MISEGCRTWNLCFYRPLALARLLQAALLARAGFVFPSFYAFSSKGLFCGVIRLLAILYVTFILHGNPFNHSETFLLRRSEFDDVREAAVHGGNDRVVFR